MLQLLRRCSAFLLVALMVLCMPITGWTQSTIKEASKEAKISPDLYQVMTNRGQLAPAVINGFSVQTNQVFAGDKVAIEAVANNEDGAGLLNQLRALGLTDGVAHKRMIFGYLPIDKLGELKNVSSLGFARSYYKPETNTGSVTSQGDAALKADLARTTYSVTGAGVKVGVISDSYNNSGGAAAGIASNDLPAAGVQVLLDLASGGSDEGRAMAEIVHDVAPGAAIAFNTAFNGQAGFAQGIIDLAAAGCKVIVDDIIYFAEPFFQDGIIAQAADQVVAAGSAYFSAAGNQARSSYQAAYKSGGTYANPGIYGTSTAYPTHDFGTGGVDNMQQITIPVGGQLRLAFQWDNPFKSVSGGAGATTDLDIIVLDATTGAVLGGSIINQSSSGDPVEVTGTITNTTGSPRLVNVVIVKLAGPDPGLIKWVNFGSRTIIPEYDTKSSSSFGHSNSAKAISVGAAPYFGTPVFNAAATATIENFSSAGGTPILFTTTGDRINGIVGTVRQKPEITSVDGGDNTFFGGDYEPNGKPNFFGTSAAAPHAAAVAALMKQKVPAITPATILSTLKSTALDMDDPSTPAFDAGFDFGTGYGFIQADRALQAISPANTAPTVANVIAPKSGTVGVGFTFTIPANTFSDPEGQALTYTVTGLPAGLTFAGTVISGTPSVSGVSTVSVKATDPGSLSASTTFQLTISPAPPVNVPPSPPAGGIPNQVATVGTAFTYVVPAFTDPNAGQTLTYSVTGLPANGLSFTAGSRTISGTPSASGTVGVTVTANDGNGGTASSSFTITINAAPVVPPANTAPTVANVIAPKSGTVGVGFTFTIPANTFSDPEGQALTYTVTGLPAGLTFAGTVISGTPSVSGVSTVSVKATDPGSLSASTTFQLTISPAPVTPPPSGPFSITGVTTVTCVTITAGQRQVSFTPRYAGLSGQPISFSVSNELSPTMAAGPYTLTLYTDNPSVTLKATQTGTAGEASFVYNWLAACNAGTPPPVNLPPVASAPANQMAVVNQAFTYVVPAFSDPNGDALTYTVSGLPAGLIFTAASRTISGTPSLTGVSTVTVKATDPGSLSASASFMLTVISAPVTPPPSGPFSITGVTTVNCTPLSAGKRTVSFTPRYAGLTGQPISFSVTNELSPTMAAGPYTLTLYTDNPSVILKATQTGTAGEASFVYNWLTACNATARQGVSGASELQTKLTVSLYPNPVGEEFSIGIKGAQGQKVGITLSDVSGRALTNTSVDVTTADHQERLRFNQERPGLYLLRVSTAGQMVVLKVIKH
ncbi:putative Ig domain-containing protein [Spirosoma utsteinense]|uniref:Dystroglycan-type cadherin-like domain-containing protein n=1 Tax=Spirosoma utsteinense TaxID=2585773 RepID=A0ABR6W2V0_9BACT|nr:putative Ig domain-containing protein [Spirosoma utsteinense]MBC3784341.1 hypothetical protein [Spirosoma utsteinense]MBC3790860.1 hypothetical protein [Spirosoma utsteinense]